MDTKIEPIWIKRQREKEQKEQKEQKKQIQEENPEQRKKREKQEKAEIKEYKKKHKTHIMTTRFNNETWSQNMAYRENHKEIGCIYSSPFSITDEIKPNEILFILEMNNDTNKIMGIGMVVNKPSINTHRVYSKETYNHNTYRGKNHIHRQDMTEAEDEIMTIFDILCFTGNDHMKRGQGIKLFPIKFLYRISKKLDLVGFIKKMFENRLSSKKI